MTDPVERERIKYWREKNARRGALIKRIMVWLPIGFFCGMGLLAAIFRNH
jgi:hypothetical protein